jgi:hypothetical protein
LICDKWRGPSGGFAELGKKPFKEQTSEPNGDFNIIKQALFTYANNLAAGAENNKTV